jgi:hypothetical protein
MVMAKAASQVTVTVKDQPALGLVFLFIHNSVDKKRITNKLSTTSGSLRKLFALGQHTALCWPTGFEMRQTLDAVE